MVAVRGPAPTAPIRIVAPGREWGVEPVELLVERGVEKVPSTYRRVSVEEEEELMALNDNSIAAAAEVEEEDRIGSGMDIPLIDLKEWDESHREEIVSKVREACEEWGFFRIVNHGVDVHLMQRMMQVAKEFIGLPIEEKAAYVGRPGMISQGYGSKYTIGAEDAVRDWRDYLFLWLQPEEVRDYAYWPSKPEAFRETMDQYSREVQELARKVLGLMSEGLAQRTGLLEEAIGEPPYQKVLINYYPACPQPQVVDGFHQHSDIGALTMVLQEDEAPVGLQVRYHNHWVPARPLPASFVVNVADQVEILTNGRYKSIEHRVVPNRHRSRLSIPVFYDAAPDVMISPVKELAQIPIYKQVKFDDHEHAFYEYGANGKNMVQSYILSNHPLAQPLSAS
ncbi:hypothetical protein GOP47_0008083 [Adiantum capillus-veneris]|uniref:Fe2OG dioxygenase domain-containing protein n=1 Tax=Adiantum capillus-veneris TaxID=13818 RepID=A0A9D4UXW1_ADICA|nr:hypothetical protein GOP47_0008083 [Adiantum capillus-veneris]